MKNAMDTGRITGELMTQYGASLLSLDREEVIFNRGDHPNFYHMVCEGQVKMTVLHESGKEFVQGYFGPGETFGEPPFFLEEPYPADAVAVERSTVWRISRENFLRLLADLPDVHMEVTRTLSRRLVYKSMMLNELAVGEATQRLRTLIGYLRRQEEAESIPFQVPFTRQDLADMTGLRVETVIRAIKSLEGEGVLSIERGKIIWSPEENPPPNSDT